MALLRFTSVLKRFFPNLQPLEIEADNVLDIILILEEYHPGLRNYILDDHHNLRKHVNIFIDGEILKNRNDLRQEVGVKSEVYVIQALSGG